MIIVTEARRMMHALSVMVVVIALLLPAHVSSAQVMAPDDIYLRVQTPIFDIDETNITVPGYDLDDTPGAPALPVWSTVVELPIGGDYQISYQTPGVTLLAQQVNLAAAPVPNAELMDRNAGMDLASLPAAPPTVDRPDPGIFGVNAFYPATPVVVGAEQWQRGRRLLALSVFPFQYNPVTRRLRYHPDVQITVTVTASQTSGGFSDGAQGLQSRAARNPAANTAGALRITTGARGLYRLTHGDLLAAGVPLDSVDVATFAVSYLGQPVAVEIMGDGDQLFEPDELVVFYAQPYEGRYQPHNTYWFTYGGAPGLRMATRSVTPVGSEPIVTTITQTVRIERQIIYESTFPLPSDVDHWFDNRMSPDIATGFPTVQRDYTITLDDPILIGAARVKATFHGGAVRPGFDPDKSVAIYLNGNLVTTHQWQGMTYTTVEQVVPASWLATSPSVVWLTASVDQIPGIEFYSIAPDWVQITYPAWADAEGDRIYIEGVAEGANQVAVSGFSASDVQVYDLRDPNQPVRLLTTIVEPAGSGYTANFWDADLPGPTYALSTPAALVAPQAIEADTPSMWGTPDPEADYIAIVHPLLWDAIDPLLAYRVAEGLRVAKVNVQDIYDEWSYGRRDPEAIRSFLSYAYRCWNGADCDPPPAAPPDPPQYVLLVGDGHYDFTGVATTLPNLIPPYLAHLDPWRGEIPADNRFVSVDGGNDFLPDMTVGRIPARSAAELSAAINKIIAYETADTDGQWQERVVFVADNNLDPAGDFHALSNDVRLNWLPPGYDDRTIYFNLDYTVGSEMRAAIKDTFNQDAFMVQWFGHGNVVRWGSVEVFRNPDIPALQANDTWPLTVSYTCLNGYFVYIGSLQQSIVEVLLFTPERGSVASIAPAGYHVGGSLLTFNRGIAQAVFQQRIERAGQAADAARQFYFANSNSFMELIDAYHYFGDPALKLRLPEAQLETSTAQVSPSAALPGETLHYTVTVQNTGAYTLTDVLVDADYDQARGQVTASNPPANNTGDVLTWTLPSLPPGAAVLTFDLLLDDIQPAGVTPIHAPVTVEAYGAPWAELDPTSQVSAAPDLSASTLEVARAWAPPAFPLTYTLTLSNTGNAVSVQTWLTATLPGDLISVTSASLLYDPPTHRLTWQGAAPVGAMLALDFSAVISPTRTACGALAVDAALRDELGQVTALAALVDLAVPDVDCDGAVDVVDIQLVTARWGAAQGDPLYHPRYDLDGDDAIGVLDVVLAATSWQ